MGKIKKEIVAKQNDIAILLGEDGFFYFEKPNSGAGLTLEELKTLHRLLDGVLNVAEKKAKLKRD